MTPEQKRLESLLKKLDEETVKAWLAYVATVRSDRVIREVVRLLSLNNIDGAVNIVNSHLDKFATVIQRNMVTVGESTVAATAVKMGRLRPSVAISFNPAHPRAAEIARRQMYDLVRDIGQNQRQSIRNSLTEAFETGANPRQASRAFRDAVGLTDYQRNAIKNYRSLLERGSVEALDRGLRDRRFQPQNMSLEGRKAYLDALTPDDIDRMVDAYEQKYLKFRGETIARTESTRTLAESNRESTLQILEAGEMGDEWVERTWQSSADERTRESHRNMERRTVRGMRERYITGKGVHMLHPGDESAPVDEVANCRCVETIRILSAEEVYGDGS